MNKNVIITAPSLDPTQNVSGVSSVVTFIINNNRECDYTHFQIGKTDGESGGVLRRLSRIWKCYRAWRNIIHNALSANVNTEGGKAEAPIIHYSFPLSAPSILRDPLFMYYAYSRGLKMLVHVHGGLFLTAPKIPWLLERILTWVFSWDVPFIVLSESEKTILQDRFGAKRVEVLPNCPEINEVQDATPNHNPNLTIGYLGRIEPNKGMAELLEALARCKREGMKFKVRFAGKEQTTDEYLPAYRKALGEDFEYCGLVSGKAKEDFIKSLDVFVMPTYFEGLPMSLLETMGYGAVPVVTPVGSIPTVVMDGENGMFIKVRDVDSICEALHRLDKDRTLLAKLCHNARQTIADNFSAKAYVEKLNDIYDSLQDARL